VEAVGGEPLYLPQCYGCCQWPWGIGNVSSSELEKK
jgi:hypothetical protein